MIMKLVIITVRICSDSGELVMSEEKDINEVLRHGHSTHIGFNQQKSLASLYCTLNTLERLPEGQYILHHNNKSEAFIRLLRSIKQNE